MVSKTPIPWSWPPEIELSDSDRQTITALQNVPESAAEEWSAAQFKLSVIRRRLELGPRRWQHILRCGQFNAFLKCLKCDRSLSQARPLYCRERWLCLGCEQLRIQGQILRWNMILRRELSRAPHVIDTDVPLLRWPLKQNGSEAELKSFNRYMQQTWRQKLAEAGVLPGKWLILGCFDPIQAEIRAVFFGPDISSLLESMTKITSRVFSFSSCIENTLLVNYPPVSKGFTRATRSRGHFSPWAPELVERYPLLNLKSRLPIFRAAEFQSSIEDSFRYVTGSALDLMTLGETGNIQRMMELAKAWKGRQFYKTYGLVHEDEDPEESVEDAPELLLLYRVPGTREQKSLKVTAAQVFGTIPLDVDDYSADSSGSGKCPGCPQCGTDHLRRIVVKRGKE